MSSTENKSLGSAFPQEETESGLPPAVSDYWEVWSRSIGMVVAPHLEDLVRRLPGGATAALCTLDGSNIVTVGIPESDVGRVSAICSSLFSISSAQQRALGAVNGGDATLVNITNGNRQTTLIALKTQDSGTFVLMASSEDVTIGLMLSYAQKVAEKIKELLAANATAAPS